ncbi:hypothetical protein SDC9_196840 [bioreactor metagenome]|uniref:Uncharacterized protein n=1 Tax=bioreactor metagenome TaxID=1076179 RepID=A0A645ID45_9ZZZZ
MQINLPGGTVWKNLKLKSRKPYLSKLDWFWSTGWPVLFTKRRMKIIRFVSNGAMAQKYTMWTEMNISTILRPLARCCWGIVPMR